MIVVEYLKSARLRLQEEKCRPCKVKLELIHDGGDRYRLKCPICNTHAELLITWSEFDYHEYPEDSELVLITNVPFFMEEDETWYAYGLLAEALK